MTNITHAVFKHADIEKLPRFARNDLATIAHLIREVRTAEGKDPMPHYIIVNTDEEPQMIEEIAEVMKKYGEWE